MTPRRPSLLSRALSTPPPLSNSVDYIPDNVPPSKAALDIPTPPTSPIRSQSSSNLFPHAAPTTHPPFGYTRQAESHGSNSLQPVQNVLEPFDSDVLICSLDIEILRDHSGRDQVFGYGAWSTVLRGAAYSPAGSSSKFGLTTPPSSPTFATPMAVAVKRPARSDAAAILRSEAKILTHLSRVSECKKYMVTFHGVILRETSLVMAAIPLSLEEHIKRCSTQSRQNLTTWNMSAPVLGSSKIWLSLAHSMISALLWLHEEAGVVHGDIKPGNFLLNPQAIYAEDGFPFQPLFIDFSSSHKLGLSDLPCGTLSAVTREYTAPELLVSSVLRDPKSAATKASDVFSLAITLLVAATGDLMVYPGSVLQRQAMATQGWQVLSLARSGAAGARVPRYGTVERTLEKAVLRAGMGRVSAGQWLKIVRDLGEGEPGKRL